jgi:hypothetical protein
MTNNDANSVHAAPVELVDYFAARLPSIRALQIEEHIADCDTCAETSRSVYFLVFAVQHLTTKDLAQAFARHVMANTLVSGKGLEIDASLTPMHSQWLRNLGHASTGVLKTIVRSSGAEFLMGGLMSIGDWRISPMHALRGLDSEVGVADREAIIQVPGANQRSAACLDRAGDRVAVVVSEWPHGCLPVAILTDVSEPDKSICGQTKQVGEGTYEIHFSGVTPGSYLMFLQSLEQVRAYR